MLSKSSMLENFSSIKLLKVQILSTNYATYFEIDYIIGLKKISM